jgi:hypothetical protein
MIKLLRQLIRGLAFIATVIMVLLTYYQYSIWYVVPIAFLGIAGYWFGTKYNAITNIHFLSFCILVTLNVLQNGVNIWLICVYLAVIAYWDLQSFANRLSFTGITQDYDLIVQQHLTRLGIVIAIGFVLSVATFYIKINISLLGIMLCALVAVITLSSAIKRLRRDTA